MISDLIIAEKQDLVGIADQLRSLMGGTDPLSLDNMVTVAANANTAVANAISAIEGKGVAVPAGTKLEGLEEAIEAIEAGGGGVTPPTPDDGKTRVYIHLAEGRTSPMMGVCPNGTVTVDWGDGTEPDILTGTSTTTVKWTPTHNYAEPGDYMIALTVDGEMGFYGSPTYNTLSGILRYSSGVDTRNRAYLNAVHKVEIGAGVTYINTYSFYYLQSLVSVVFLKGVTGIGNYGFYCCYSARYYDFTACKSVPTLGAAQVFESIPDDCIMLIPAALYDEWSTATNWATYASYMVAKEVTA